MFDRVAIATRNVFIINNTPYHSSRVVYPTNKMSLNGREMSSNGRELSSNGREISSNGRDSSSPSTDRSMETKPGHESPKLCRTCGGSAAFYSCLECEGSLCETCVETHSKRCTGQTRGSMCNTGVEVLTHIPAEEAQVGADRTGCCTLHPGKLLDMFCEQHDVFVCSTCVDIRHRACKDVSSVSKLAQKVTKSKEYKKFSTNLTHAREKLSRIRKDQKEAKRKLRQETDTSLSAIAEFRKDINWVLDRLEKKGKGFIEKRFKELNKRIEEDISACDDMIDVIDKLIRKLEAKEDKTGVFHSVKKEKNKLEMAEKVCQEMKSGLDLGDMVKFSVDPKVKEFAMGLGWYGKDRTYLSFEPPVTLPHMYSVKNETNFDVRAKADRGVCGVTSCCQFPDGTFLITDTANRKVKHVDVTYKVADCISVPGDPLACCVTAETSSGAVSVSDGNRHIIQFVGIENSRLTKTGEITVGKPCKGLAALSDKLITASDDSICDYTYDGEFLREIYKDISSPIESFTANDIASKLFAALAKGSILQLDSDGVIMREMRDPSLTLPRGLALDRTDQLFVVGYESNNVCMFSHEGESMGNLSYQSHKYKNPQMVFFDRYNCRLMLALRGCNTIKVCDLK